MYFSGYQKKGCRASNDHTKPHQGSTQYRGYGSTSSGSQSFSDSAAFTTKLEYSSNRNIAIISPAPNIQTNHHGNGEYTGSHVGNQGSHVSNHGSHVGNHGSHVEMGRDINNEMDISYTMDNSASSYHINSTWILLVTCKLVVVSWVLLLSCT